MGELTRQNYMNPITLEARMFVKSIIQLSETYNYIDKSLIDALDSVMTAINTFLDKNPKQICQTKKTNVLEATKRSVRHLKRTYHCTRCNKDLGECSVDVTKHVIERCENIENANEKIEMECPDVELMKINTRPVVNYPMIIKKRVEVADHLQNLFNHNIIKQDIIDVVNIAYPHYEINVHTYGPRVAGIGTRNSNLELLINVYDNTNGIKVEVAWGVILKILERKPPKRMKKIWTGAKHMIGGGFLKCTHVSSSIVCDIHFSNILGYTNTLLFDYLFKLQPIARIMCIYLERWITINGIRCIDIQTTALMVIFYLQQLKYLPSIEDLQKDVNLETALYEGPWLCSYVPYSFEEIILPLLTSSNHSEPKHDCDIFMFRFFNFYINFDYESYLICPYFGEIIKKDDFQEHMPKRFTDHYAAKPWNLDDSIIIIQHPIELTCNVAENIDTIAWKIIRKIMIETLRNVDNKWF